jgi:hypothetical protein
MQPNYTLSPEQIHGDESKGNALLIQSIDRPVGVGLRETISDEWISRLRQSRH